MLSPKRHWELINKTRDFAMMVCDKLNKVAVSLLETSRNPILPNPAFGMKKE